MHLISNFISLSIQKCKPLLVPADPDELPGVDVHPYFSLMVLRRAVTELRERVNDVCDRELARISDLSEFFIKDLLNFLALN